MRIIRYFLSRYAFLFCSVIAASAVCFAQINQESTIKSLLAEMGYKYVEVKEGQWRVPDLPHQGLNFKSLDVYFESNTSNHTLKISALLGRLTQPAATEEFKGRLATLNERYKPSEFVITKTSLFVVTELPAENLDRKTLAQAIDKVAQAANESYPDVARFIVVERKESLGTGGGMGVGPGYQLKDPAFNTPQTSQNSTATTVDSKPIPLNSVRPEYTEEARNNKTQGEVLLRVLVGEDGTIKTVRVIRGLPDGLNEKAIEAARKTKFRPAMKDGKPVAYSILLRITFNIF